MTYRIKIISGALAGRTVTTQADTEFSAFRILSDALGDVFGEKGWPVLHVPGAPTLFGVEPDVETITLEQALEALNA